MPFLGIGKGQTELIHRGERTSPSVIVGQGVALILVTLFAFVVIRVYAYYWDWITKNDLHSWLAPVGIILVVGCVFLDIVLYMELNDPNWPPTRNPTDSTRPLHPLSRDRMKPKGDTVSINLKWKDLLDALNLEMVEEDDEEEDAE